MQETDFVGGFARHERHEPERSRLEQEGADRERLGTAAQLLDSMFSAKEFPEFLTLEAYGKLA